MMTTDDRMIDGRRDIDERTEEEEGSEWLKGDVVVAPVWRKSRSHETMAAWPRMYRILAACGSGLLPGFTFLPLRSHFCDLQFANKAL